ncbi:MAG: CerR family C-terminal domain-containing protein, partial [Rhodocyclaceae bacterium]|nr:CerR family C-terminal domain-containing protein [Rhodocyclaceae bacterium]
AAVNYYFGGKERLYEEVLREAHQQISSLEELDAIASSAMPPAEKLRALLARLMHTALHAGDLWGIKIFLRELADPSPLALKNVTTVALPKALKVRAIIEEASGLPADSPQLQWAAGLALMPCIGFILFPDALKTLHFPNMPQNASALLDAMHCYISGGLAALRAREEGAGQNVDAN